jgi:hypothetical protein
MSISIDVNSSDNLNRWIVYTELDVIDLLFWGTDMKTIR